MINRQVVTTLLMSFLVISSAALADSEAPVSLRVFSPPDLSCNGMGCPRGTDELREWRRKQEKQNLTLREWLSRSNRPIAKRDQKLFEKGDVSYLVTFPEKSEIGVAKLIQSSSVEANGKAAELIQKLTPLGRPPSGFPYSRGLLIKFRGSKMFVHLAPK
jgi:hypothetical protein